MKIAVDLFPTDRTINPVEFAKVAEDPLTRAVITVPQGTSDEVLLELERVVPLIDAMRDA